MDLTKLMEHYKGFKKDARESADSATYDDYYWNGIADFLVYLLEKEWGIGN